MSNEDVKRKMQQAKQLIDQKRYEEAEEILLFVDHPTASKWLASIETLRKRQSPVQRQPAQPSNLNGKFVWSFGFFCMVFGLVFGIVFLVLSGYEGIGPNLGPIVFVAGSVIGAIFIQIGKRRSMPPDWITRGVIIALVVILGLILVTVVEQNIIF